jgi:hypothetical protein
MTPSSLYRTYVGITYEDVAWVPMWQWRWHGMDGIAWQASPKWHTMLNMT